MNAAISKVSNPNLISECHNRLNKIGKMTLNSKIDEKTRQFLLNSTPKRLKELAQMNCYAADKIKSELDKKYGENNYVMIAVGRSISAIAELMEKMGADTRIIPLSGLRRWDERDIQKDGLEIYKTFLVQKGLSKTDLKQNKNKTYILMDYAHYGRSLENTEKILKREDMLGNADNLISMSANNVLGDDFALRKFEYLFMYSRFKDYSYVGKLHIDNLKDVYNQCSPERIKEYQSNITQGLRKLFWFNVFDSYLNQNYKKAFPLQEMNALYKHYLSAKAMKNYLKRELEKQQKDVDTLINKK